MREREREREEGETERQKQRATEMYTEGLQYVRKAVRGDTDGHED